MKEFFGVVALVVSLLANVPYIIEIIQKKTRPERISWLLWTVLGAVYFFSTIFDEGAKLFTLGEVLAPVVIFILALKYGVGGKSRFDMVCLGVAAIALGLLFVVDSVLISLLLALFVDAVGIVLTIRKLRIDPSSESRAFWGMGAIASVFALLSLQTYSLTAILFPIYVLIISTYIFTIAKPSSVKQLKEIEKL